MLARLKSSPFWDQTFLFLIGLGVIVSMQMAWVPGFFHDGYLYGAFGKNAAELGKWLVPHLSEYSYPRFEQHLPTLFILEGIFFKIFGSSYVSARIFISLFFIITGIGLFKWSNEKEDRIFGYYSLFFFFVIPPLIKKVRFPNLDIALMCMIFWGFYFFSKAINTNSWRNWLLTGLFFGMSLLIKGPMGALLPIGIFTYLLLTKNLKVLLLVRPWAGLFLGFLIFSLWPLSLYLTGNFQIFLDWYKFTFVITIGKSRSVAEPFYSYILFLLKQTPLWIALLIWGLAKEKNKNNFLFPLSFFIGILFFLSIPKFKYSNYLMPLYPFLAISTAYGLRNISKKIYGNIYKGFIGLSFLGALILLIFPLTVEVRRDKGIHEFKEVLKYANIRPEHWYNVSWTYSGTALASINAFEENSKITSSPPIDEVLLKEEESLLRKVLVVNLNEGEKIKFRFSKIARVAIIKKYNVEILMHKDFFFVSKPFQF